MHDYDVGELTKALRQNSIILKDISTILSMAFALALIVIIAKLFMFLFTL